ncbi:hypothetical protein H072_3877 [Dactylellina haptotyla CBS 200.50]|uniref:Uncharacterized protein n=1 Tax=Dactylellina haptotyla (strain CBS 200.50) TaxID=1284197 RepID=S8BRK4_DACHA|nr:hypothetical protein H072_3877 [Dactylellina haptotyla CBS 200.50]
MSDPDARMKLRSGRRIGQSQIQGDEDQHEADAGRDDPERQAVDTLSTFVDQVRSELQNEESIASDEFSRRSLIGGSEDDSQEDEHLGPISADTDAAKIWEEVMDAFTAYMTASGVNWCALQLDADKGEASVTILYRVGGDWEETTVISELRAQFFPEDIFPSIKFLVGEVRRAATHVATDASYEEVNCDQSDGGVYGLTCHHVVLPTKLAIQEDGSEEEEEEEEIDLGAVAPDFLLEVGKYHGAFNPGMEEVKIMSPPCSDHIKRWRNEQNDRERLERGLQDLEGRYTESEPSPPGLQKIKRQKQAIAAQNEIMAKVSDGFPKAIRNLRNFFWLQS